MDGKEQDCRTGTPPFYLAQACLDHIRWVTHAAAEQGMYVTLTVRAAVAAGGSPGKPSVFTNTTLRQQYLSMLESVARAFANESNVAWFEPMSEPRSLANDPPEIVRWYSDACEAVRAGDPALPCLVGPADYYSVFSFLNHTSRWAVPASNVLYAVDMFFPRPYVKPSGANLTYPMTKPVPCRELFGPDWAVFCSSADEPITNNRSVLELAMDKLVAARRVVGAPVFLNQWGVYADAPGRLQWTRDFLTLAQGNGMHTGLWQWKADGPVGYGVIRHPQGSTTEWETDQDLVRTLRPFF